MMSSVIVMGGLRNGPVLGLPAPERWLNGISRHKCESCIPARGRSGGNQETGPAEAPLPRACAGAVAVAVGRCLRVLRHRRSPGCVAAVPLPPRAARSHDFREIELGRRCAGFRHKRQRIVQIFDNLRPPVAQQAEPRFLGFQMLFQALQCCRAGSKSTQRPCWIISSPVDTIPSGISVRSILTPTSVVSIIAFSVGSPRSFMILSRSEALS